MFHEQDHQRRKITTPCRYEDGKMIDISTKGQRLIHQVESGETDIEAIQSEHDELDVDLQDALSGTPRERVRKFVTGEALAYFSKPQS